MVDALYMMMDLKIQEIFGARLARSTSVGVRMEKVWFSVALSEGIQHA